MPYCQTDLLPGVLARARMGPAPGPATGVPYVGVPRVGAPKEATTGVGFEFKRLCPGSHPGSRVSEAGTPPPGTTYLTAQAPRVPPALDLLGPLVGSFTEPFSAARRNPPRYLLLGCRGQTATISPHRARMVRRRVGTVVGKKKGGSHRLGRSRDIPSRCGEILLICTTPPPLGPRPPPTTAARPGFPFDGERHRDGRRVVPVGGIPRPWRVLSAPFRMGWTRVPRPRRLASLRAFSA